MVNRVYISPSVVTVSKPGYDALSPAGVSYDYLALDSRLDQVRPLLIGSVTAHVNDRVYYGQTFANIPFVHYLGYNPHVYKDIGSSGYHMRSSFNFVMMADSFIIGSLQVHTQDPLIVNGFVMNFIVWERL